MTDTYSENKWDKFELSGRVSDYLDYKGITTKSFSNVKGARSNADNAGRNSYGGKKVR